MGEEPRCGGGASVCGRGLGMWEGPLVRALQCAGGASAPGGAVMCGRDLSVGVEPSLRPRLSQVSIVRYSPLCFPPLPPEHATNQYFPALCSCALT